jgi:hypothetical protein
MFSRGVNRVRRHYVLEANQFSLNETARECRGHFAGTEKADGELGCHESFVAGQLMERK